MKPTSMTGIRAASKPCAEHGLRFAPIRLEDVPVITRLTSHSGTRGCDLTVGGIYMWVDYFHYRMAVVDDTLFISGVTEDDTTRQAFSVPVGKLPLDDAIMLIRRHCAEEGRECRFSAVPEELIDHFRRIPGAVITELTDFADYIYDAHALAELSGKKLSKKRNHVNRFIADNPGYSLLPLTADTADDALAFLDRLHMLKDSASATYEMLMARDVVKNIGSLPFVGALLVTPTHGVVGITVGEVVGDTLHIHIEKMDHRVEGAGETINKLFAAHILSLYPEVVYINREDDAGDPGLRFAKQSYHPVSLLRKYNVTLPLGK